MLVLGMNTYTDWIYPEELCNEFGCTEQGHRDCCGTLWCAEHYPAHIETHTARCGWCNGTGVYSGPMLNSHYAGPCLMCG